MRNVRLAAAFALLAGFAPLAVSARDEPAMSAGVGAGNLRLGHITAVGMTKPGGAPLDARLGTTKRLEIERFAIDRRIRQAICTGC